MHDVILEYYQRNVGLYDLFPIITKFPEAIKSIEEKQHIKLLKSYGEGKDNENGTITYKVPPQIGGVHDSFLDKKKSYTLAEDMLPQSIIVLLVSQFDLFVSHAIRYIYKKKPVMLNSIQRNISYAEINALGDIEKIKEYLIEKEIETVLRDSHHSQICWFEKKLDTTLQADTRLVADFIEITQRRNLFVHSDGIASQQYISICKEHGNDCEGINAGQKLKVDSAYFNHSADRLIEIGCKLGQIIWRKVCPEERIRSNDSLVEITYNLIKRGRFRAASLILEFFIANRGKLIHDDTCEYIVIINAAQAYKWFGNNNRCQELLDMEDWHSKSDNFLLAALVLKEKYSEAAEVMRRIGPERHGINKGAYMDWPLFKEFRKTQEFQNVYKELYSEEYTELKKEWIIQMKT